MVVVAMYRKHIQIEMTKPNNYAYGELERIYSCEYVYNLPLALRTSEKVLFKLL